MYCKYGHPTIVLRQLNQSTFLQITVYYSFSFLLSGFICSVCNTMFILACLILCRTFSFLQFIFPAVTLASDQLLLLQASLERAESVHIEPSILPWKQNKSHFCFR